MIIISHRGNVEGPNPDRENREETIAAAIAEGFDCEIDVWLVNGTYYLGHDYPETAIEFEFLEFFSEHLWIHCKHLDSLVALRSRFNCFYHNKDIYTLTSRGHIWGNINSPCHPQAIQVMPEKSGVFSLNCYGICTDYPMRYLQLTSR